ncbi:MAG: phage minor capsid protein [Clostridiales bacterium]|nr:phage minor capsid protein [Clostridiales bacterium]
MERTIRKLQRERLAYEAVGDTDRATAINIRINRLKQKYKEFSKAAGLKERTQRMNVEFDNNNPVKPVANSDESGIIELNRNTESSKRFSTTQEQIDNLIECDLSGVSFTSKPKYNSRIKDNGKTTIREYSDGTVKEIVKVEIGKQDKSSAEFLEDTILHEELEARIAIRSKYSERYKKLYNSSETDRHNYINKIIKKYFKMKGWNYDLG